MTIEVLSLAGTGFPDGGDGVLESFLAALPPDRFRGRIVRYPADFGMRGTTYADSRAAGLYSLGQAAAECESRGVSYLVAGYSQGAVVAGDFAAALGPASLCVGAALIADGYRPAGEGVLQAGHQMAPGYGIGGQRPIHGVRAWWVSAPGDPICALPAGNPLRMVADLAEYFSLRGPAEATVWMARALARVAEGRLQPWWRVEHWRDWGGAAAFARGYLFDGRHTLDYVRYGYTHALAQAVVAELGPPGGTG